MENDVFSEMAGDFVIVVAVFVIILIIAGVLMSRKKAGGSSQQAQRSANAARHAQIVEDIKATPTSRIVDSVAILDELSQTTGNYRQYCELVGTSMASGGVTAPYSKRQVAYYDLRCYRIESVNGVEKETLVSQEKSIDPFYFTDGSGDDRVYVNLDSFGTNCILVNATDRVEGPNSDFSKAVSSAIGSAPSGGYNPALAIAEHVREKGESFLAMLRGGMSALQHPMRPAYALASAGYAWTGTSRIERDGGNIVFSHGPGFGGPGGRPSYGGSFPGGLDSFLGGALGGSGSFGGPAYRGMGRTSSGSSATGMLLGMGLSAILSQLASANFSETLQSPQQQPSLRGYHIVEDVVPLQSPIYCLGELYRHGTDVYMGASTSENYPSSYFATKPEVEVISHLSK